MAMQVSKTLSGNAAPIVAAFALPERRVPSPVPGREE